MGRLKVASFLLPLSKRLLSYRETKYRGVEKNDQYHLLLAVAYNIRKAPALAKKLQGLYKEKENELNKAL